MAVRLWRSGATTIVQPIPLTPPQLPAAASGIMSDLAGAAEQRSAAFLNHYRKSPQPPECVVSRRLGPARVARITPA